MEGYRILCSESRIDTATKMGILWGILNVSEIPNAQRIKTGKNIKEKV